MRSSRIGGMMLAAASLWGMASASARAGDITFWTWRQEDRAAFAELFADFTKANPDIHVKFEAFAPANYNTIVSAALAAGHGGDVLGVRAYGGLEQLATAGYLKPLDAKTVPELANLPAEALAAESVRADHRVYAVAFASQTLGLLINKDIFAKAGVTPPTDWAGFLAACAKLKAAGVIPIANGTATGWMDEVMAGIFTGPFLGNGFMQDVVAGRATFADPRYVAALGHLLELRPFMPPGYTGIDYPTAQQLFLSGRAAMFAGGSFEIANFRKQNPKLALDFIAPPAPKAGEPQYVSKFFDGGYAVNAKSAHGADALKLVRWMGTTAYADKFSSLLGNISPIKGVTISDPLLAKVAKLNEVSVPYVMAVYFRYETPTGSELLQNGLQRMMAGSETPAQLGAEVTAGIAKYYKPFQKK
ncbi:MAG: extracellular solute-binding protein [Rhodospirillales bacterium]|nr:extracellular solute-binding protein [Rhodospirillales bacterium]